MKTNLFEKIETSSTYAESEDRATYKGIALKLAILLLLTVTVGVIVAIYTKALIENEQRIGIFYGILIGSAIVSLICGIAGRFDTRATKYLSVIYALSEGIMLGFITRLVEYYAPGVGFICVGATALIFAIVLLMNSLGIFRGSSQLFKIAITILVSALILSIFTLVLSLTMRDSRTYLWLSIIVEVFFLFYAVIVLTFNFDEARAIVNQGCRKNSEWCVALGLEVSLIFIYIELLRIVLLIMEASRR